MEKQASERADRELHLKREIEQKRITTESAQQVAGSQGVSAKLREAAEEYLLRAFNLDT